MHEKEYDDKVILRYLDSPVRIGPFNASTVIAFCSIFMGMNAINKPLLAIILSFIGAIIVSYFNSYSEDYSFRQILYWYGILKIKDYPPASVREFIG